jgi:hypothetical protein
MPRTFKRSRFFNFPECKFRSVFFSHVCYMSYPSHFRWVVAGNSLADSINVPSLRYKALKANYEFKCLLHAEWIIEYNSPLHIFRTSWMKDRSAVKNKKHKLRGHTWTVATTALERPQHEAGLTDPSRSTCTMLWQVQTTYRRLLDYLYVSYLFMVYLTTLATVSGYTPSNCHLFFRKIVGK